MASRILGVIAALLFLGGVAAYFEVAPEEAASSRPRAVLASADAAPSVDQDALAAWRDTTLLRPRSLPAGWRLVFADVLPAVATIERCRQFELDYHAPGDDPGYLYLYQFPKACAQSLPGVGITPFTAGAYRGTAVQSPDDVVVQLTVGEATVQAHTNLSLAELATILDAFVPLRAGDIPRA